jgi:probable HAF family extracellular repeat protein
MGVHSTASDISADGSKIVGGGTSASGGEAFLWTSGGGMVGLDDLPGGTFASGARAISADGSAIVGSGTSASGEEAFRWTSGGGMVGLGDLPGGVDGSRAVDVTADGSTVVGNSFRYTTEEYPRPFIWDTTHGMRDLLDALVELGAGPALQGWTLKEVIAISDDGRAILGTGDCQCGANTWLVILPEPSTGLLVIAGLLGLAGWRRARA